MGKIDVVCIPCDLADKLKKFLQDFENKDGTRKFEPILVSTRATSRVNQRSAPHAVVLPRRETKSSELSSSPQISISI